MEKSNSLSKKTGLAPLETANGQRRALKFVTGFSLIELIIAVGILSAGITFIVQALGFSGRAAGLSGDVINACLISQDKIQELEFKEKLKQLKEENALGKQDKFEWQYTVSNFDPAYDLFYLELLVSWLRKNQTENIVLNTYLRQ